MVGLSILSGAHMALCPRIIELLRAQGLDDVVVLVGGIIPDEDIEPLQGAGRARASSARAPARRTSSSSFGAGGGRATRQAEQVDLTVSDGAGRPALPSELCREPARAWRGHISAGRRRRAGGAQLLAAALPAHRPRRTSSASPARRARASPPWSTRWRGLIGPQGRPSASSPSTRPAHSPAARCWATVCACATWPATPASSSAAWRRVAAWAAWRTPPPM